MTALALTTDSPPPVPEPGAYAGQQWIAVGVVAVVVVIAWVVIRAWSKNVSKAHGGLIIGADNRVSTGKVVAVGWTVLVAWMVATEAFVGAKGPATFTELMNGASDLYFVFLGGPYAAAAFAKASTQTKIAQGTLTKTSAGSPSPLDVIADDNGNVDVYDFQYTLFNLLAIIIVLFSFFPHPGHGLPEIPQFLAILTGGAALTYTVNKTIVTDGPTITSVKPPTARVGDTVTITGVQLFPNVAGSALPTVTIGPINATAVAVPAGTTNTLTATVVDAPGNAIKLSGPVDVTVVPPLGSPIVLRNGITIVADEPTLTSVVTPRDPFKANDTLTVAGSLLLPPGTADGTAAAGESPGGLKAELRTESLLAWDIGFEGPYSNEVVTLKVGDQPAGVVGKPDEKQKARLTLERGAKRTPPLDVTYSPTP